jgi:hypothetical protein
MPLYFLLWKIYIKFGTIYSPALYIDALKMIYLYSPKEEYMLTSFSKRTLVEIFKIERNRYLR